jgi:hypothetical protein
MIFIQKLVRGAKFDDRKIKQICVALGDLIF